MATLLLFILITIAGINRAHAKPVPPPDLTQCQGCCLPVGNNKIMGFNPPPYSKPRVRTAAHLADKAYIEKYTQAIERMKALGPAHPWNHFQQAKVHCAYCNGAYNMSGYNVPVQVHDSWLFFPFHRLYLYFYERILGRLLNDDMFAIPFWNWDSPDGMTIPEMYVNPSSALHDPLRDEVHQPPTIIDLNYIDADALNTVNLTERNLHTVYRQMVSATTAELFYGRRYAAGDEPSPGAGSIESMPHSAVHSWTGDRKQKNGENMGAFYTAGRDPVFYAHHANVDRMWHLWSTKLARKNRRAFSDDDWLDASFLFWDENLRLVRATVRDSLDMSRLGYTYQDVEMRWAEYKPVKPAQRVEKPEATEEVRLPVRLESPVTVGVKRLRVMRSEEEKEREEEVLVVDDIELMKSESVKFDVYVNAWPGDEEGIGPESAHFAGSFVHLAKRMGRRSEMMRTRLMLGIGELLREIDADGDDSIVVSLIPRNGGSKVSVGDIRVGFSS